MYAWLWQRLPGDTSTKAFAAFVGVLVICVILWYVVFPWIEPRVQFDHGSTVDGGGSSAPPRTHRTP